MWIFHKGTSFVTKLVPEKRKHTTKISNTSLLNVIQKSREQGILQEREKKILENIITVRQREINAIITPRNKVFALPDTCTLKEAMEKSIEKKFSRIPVYSGSIDNILGVLYLKDLTLQISLLSSDEKISHFIQPPLFIYNTIKIFDVFEEFRSKRIHLGIVVDEFGGMEGIVTLEDILEEIVGEILDEKDNKQSVDIIKNIGKNKWIAIGRADVHTVNKTINGEIIHNDEYDTLQGLLMYHLKRIPHIGEKITINNFTFKVTDMEKNEIKLIAIKKEPENRRNTKVKG